MHRFPRPAPVSTPRSELKLLVAAKIDRFRAEAKRSVPEGGERLTTQKAVMRMASLESQPDCVFTYRVNETVPVGRCAAVCMTGGEVVRLRIFFRLTTNDWCVFEYDLVTRLHRGTKQQRTRGMKGHPSSKRYSWKRRNRK